MLEKRHAGMIIAVIVVIVVAWARLFRPTWDYYPPDRLLDDLERSWIVAAGVRDLAFAGYIVVALGMMTLFFSILQRRWVPRSEGGRFGPSARRRRTGHAGIQNDPYAGVR